MPAQDGPAKTERPRIAAMERGPGPGKYSLPGMTGNNNHDCRKRVLPAYSFGLKLGTSFIRTSKNPGPGYAIDPAVTRFGRDGTASYSVYGRPKDLEPFKTPGAATYAPEKYPYPYSPRAPAYSLGLRTKYRKRDSNPSPNSYTLPTMLGDKVVTRSSSANFIMTSRSKLGGFDCDYAKTPGPARYGVTSADIHKRKSPAYSLLSRRFMPGDNTKKPGPGAHSPERTNITYKSPPSFTMGVKHSEYMCPLIIDVSE